MFLDHLITYKALTVLPSCKKGVCEVITGERVISLLDLRPYTAIKIKILPVCHFQLISPNFIFHICNEPFVSSMHNVDGPFSTIKGLLHMAPLPSISLHMGKLKYWIPF